MTHQTNWHIERRKGIGGSDAAAILGLSPWKSAMDVWLEKLGLAEERFDPARKFLLDLGTELEPIIANCYTRQTGRTLRKVYAQVHKDFPILRGNPDRMVVGEKRGVELKTENQFADEFGEPGTDEVPKHYLIQCAHYMAVTDIPVWDVALLRGGAQFSIYTIERDMELEADMVSQLCEWWEKHITGKRPPDIDGSGAWNVYLRKRFPADILPVKSADADTLALINNLRTIREIVDQYSGLQKEIENRLKEKIGDHQGLTGEFGRITWKKTKDSQDVDWKAAFTALSLYHEIPNTYIREVMEIATTPKSGARRFLFTPRKDWVYDGRTEIAGSGAARIGTGALPGDSGDGAGGAGESGDRSALHHGGTPPA